MLQSTTDFTIPQSYCNLYYKNIHGTVLKKTYFKKALNPFYINGDAYFTKNNE